MAYPIGGRADKYGNRYEYNWTINKLLDVIDEDILSITLEAIGEEEQGIDLWIKNKDKSMEGQQCKGRNSSKESWTFSEVSKLGILSNWKKHLNYSESNKVSIVSPICFTVFEDLTELSRNTDLNKPEAFVDKQVFSNKTGRRTKNLFVDICRSIDIDYTTPSGKIKAQQFFSRMYYRQVPDSTLKDLVLRRIDLLFANEKYEVYGKLLEILLMEDILGKEIDIVFINKFIEDRGIKYLDLSHDERIVPAINKLNKEYHKSFIPLKGGLIQRTTFEKSRELLERGESIIIHGNAGTGKSGCTEVIINYCINNSIPYLAIKLDKHIPEYNSKKWGETLGLPASIAQCINAISNDRRGVLILDQLDAIRWTQVHTGDALLICDEIIDEVRNINLRRKFPLSIVFVCRTYDFESDRSIASLFKSGNNDSFVWNKIKINTLDQKTVEKIVGSQYQSLSSKLKNLLSVFSNLYIWEQLDDKEECLEINTTYGLIHKWWEQIVFRARRQNFDTSKLENLKNQINQFIDRQGRLFVPTSVIDISPVYLDFLKSNGFITDEGKKIAFVHQSITDCFLSDIMIQRHFNGDTVLQILGDKAKQTPSRRYQLQLFLQQLAEYDIEDFLVTGEAILKENGIRYNLKYVPLEVIAQLSSKKDSCVFKYIIEKLEEPEWNTHFLNNVVTGKKEYIRYLREKGILKNWMEMKGEEQERVILLMSSIAPDYNRDDIQFIEEYALKNKMWYACFYTDIHEGSDEYFELRMRFYRCFPDFILRYININKAMKNCEIRTIRMIALMIELSVQNDEQRVYSYTEDYISDKTDYCISNYLDVFKYLWPLLPDKEDNVVFKNWSLYQMNHKSLERLCTNIVKKALRKCAVDNSDLLIEKLRPYLGCGNDYYNELILDSFKYLPTDKADFVVSYLMSDFNKRGFERTSGNKNKLLSLQQVIKKHAEFCSDTVYEQLEDKVIHFVPDNSKDILKRRIEFNREKNRDHVYCDYWGDFQYEIIQCFPEKRKSEVVRKLWITLLRRRGSKQSIYAYDWPQGGGIRSPIDGKKLSNKSWKQIINNQDISDNCKKIGRFKKGFFIENTINEFAASFQRYVYDNPIEALKLLIENNYYVNPIYIDSAWSGLSNSEMIDSVPNTYIELLIKKYGFNMSDFRARDICSCIERKEDTQWSDDIYQCLNEIATKHKSPEKDSPIVYSIEDKNIETAEMLVNNAINSVRGSAARAIGHLLLNEKDLFKNFKETIIKIACDNNEVTRCAAIWALCPCYYISRDWAVETIYQIILKDCRTIISHNSRVLFCETYSDYKDNIHLIISRALRSNDKEMLQVCGYCITELYMLHDDFSEFIEKYSELNDEIRPYILKMVIKYFSIQKYRDKAKRILLQFAKVEHEKVDAYEWGSLFRDNLVDIDSDRGMIEVIVYSVIGKYIIESFLDYIDANKARKKYAPLILNACKNIIQLKENKRFVEWEIETILIKTVIGLYEEVKMSPHENDKEIASKCLDIWDIMYEKDIGSAKQLTVQFMEI